MQVQYLSYSITFAVPPYHMKGVIERIVVALSCVMAMIVVKCTARLQVRQMKMVTMMRTATSSVPTSVAAPPGAAMPRDAISLASGAIESARRGSLVVLGHEQGHRSIDIRAV